LAKRREDRYQTAGQMLEDLVIAQGSGLVIPELGGHTTISPDMDERVATDEDEQTLVRPRVSEYVPPAPRSTVNVPLPPPAPVASKFNPWRIIIPSLAGLLVVFAVIYAFTQSSQPANANQSGTQTLSADPNSQPVQPTAPPTGQPEQGVPLGGVVNPTSNANANSNANVAVSPSPAAEANA